MRQPPEYGRPGAATERNVAEILATLKNFLKDRVMSIITKRIAGLSIVEITDALLVEAARIVDINTVEVGITPRPTAQPDAFYAVSLKVNGEEVALDGVTFTQTQIDNATQAIILFPGIDVQNASSIIAEASIDPMVAVIRFAFDLALGIGSTDMIPLLMDIGSQGLAGYDMALSVNPTVAIITAVTFPPVGLSNVDILSDGSHAAISLVDLQDEVNPGEFDELLATVELQGIAAGQTKLSITINALDGESGFNIRRVLREGTITVN